MKLVEITKAAVMHFDEVKPELDDNIAAIAPQLAVTYPEAYVVIFGLDVIHDHDDPASKPRNIEFTTCIPVISATEPHDQIVSRAKAQLKSDFASLADQIDDVNGSPETAPQAR